MRGHHAFGPIPAAQCDEISEARVLVRWSIRGEMRRHLSLVRRVPVLEKVDPLPGSEEQLAARHRN